jgi:hypothetical protein
MVIRIQKSFSIPHPILFVGSSVSRLDSGDAA